MILPEVTDKSEVNASKDDALTITSPQEAKPGITSQFNFLREDPSSYFYQKFKQSGSMYLKDKMWAEASKKGQTDLVAYYINENEKYDKQLLDQKKTDERHIDTITKMNEYADEMDYDGYITALANITLDDTDESRKDRISDDGQYNFGTFTDREWNEKILDAQYKRYDAIRIEEYKANRSFWEKAAMFLPNLFVTVGGELLVGIMNFVNDIYNVGEGLVNMCVNWTGDDNVGSRFLAAFQDDDWLQQACDGLSDAILDYEKNYSITGLVDAVKAYDDPESKGVTGWGQMFNGLFESIGYMIPSIVLTQGIGAAAGTGSASAGAAYSGIAKTYRTAGKAALHGVKQAAINKAIGTASRAIFYTGVFSGNIRETVGGYKAQIAQQGKDATYAYRDLSAVDVVVNAGAKAVGQMLVEDALAWVLDASITDRLMYGSSASTQKIIKQAIPNVEARGVKAAGIAIGRGLKASLKEGLEESLQDMSDGLIDLAYSKLNGGTNLDEVFSASAAEKFNLKNLIQSFVMGAAMDITVGSVKNLAYVSPENRQAYEGSDGKVYKMGAFQTMNFNAALETMQQWNSIISDRSASRQDRADAAYRMAITIDTLTPLFRTMTNSDIVMANQMLKALAKDNKTKESVKALYSENDFTFGKRLLDTLLYSTTQYNETWTKQKAEAKLAKINAKKEAITKSLGNKKDYLQEKNVTQVTNVVTTEMTDAEIEEAGLPKTTKEFMEKSGADTLVTVDGTGAAIQDGKTVILDSKLAKQGDIPTILRTEAHEIVVEDVAKSLPSDFKKFLLKVFRNMTGDKKSTYKQAIKALLFDSNFFAEMLIQSNGQMDFQRVLTHLDSIYKSSLLKASQEADTLSAKAVKALMNKVRENMKQALFKYCTQYILVDLDSVSTTILSKEDKKAIKEYASVQLAEQYKDLKKEATKAPVEIYDKNAFYYVKRALEVAEKNFGVLAKIGLTPEDVIKKLQSHNRNTRTDALAVIQKMTTYNGEDGFTKLAYSPAEVLNKREQDFINSMYDRFGIKNISDLSGDGVDWNNVTDDIKSLIVSNQYNVNNKNDRNKIADKVIYDLSGGTLAITPEFNIVRVLDADTYLAENLKSESLVEANNALIRKVKSGTGTVRDLLNPDSYYTEAQWADKDKRSKISNIDKKPVLSNIFLDTKIILVKDNSKVAGSASDYANSIELNTKFKDTISLAETLFHELTHITQGITSITSGLTTIVNGSTRVYTKGGTPETFSKMSYSEASRVTDYLAKNFPMIYKLLENEYGYTDFSDVIYALLEGELQANLYLGEVLDTLGFRFLYKDGRNYLISPDDDQYDITSVQSGLSYAVPLPNKNEYIYQVITNGGLIPIAQGKGLPVVTTPDKIMSYGINNEKKIGKLPKFEKMTTDIKSEIRNVYKQEKIDVSNFGNFTTLENVLQHIKAFNKILNYLPEGAAKAYVRNFINTADNFMNWLNKAYSNMVDDANALTLDKKYMYDTVIKGKPPASVAVAVRDLDAVFKDYANKKTSFDQFAQEVFSKIRNLSEEDIIDSIVAYALENNMALEEAYALAGRLDQLTKADSKSILPMLNYGENFNDPLTISNELGETAANNSKNIEFVKNASDMFKLDDGRPKYIYRGVSHNVKDSDYHRGIFFTDNIGMAGSYTWTGDKYKAGDIKGYICNVKDNEMVKVNYQPGNNTILWQKIPLSSIDTSNLPDFNKNFRKFLLEYKHYVDKYDKYNSIEKYINGENFYLRSDDIRLFLLKYYPNIKGLAINNIYDFSSGPLSDEVYKNSQVFVLYDKSNIKEVSINDNLYDTIRLIAQPFAEFIRRIKDYGGLMTKSIINSVKLGIKSFPDIKTFKEQYILPSGALSVDEQVLRRIRYLTENYIGSIDDVLTILDTILQVIQTKRPPNLESLTDRIWDTLNKNNLIDKMHKNILAQGGDYTSETEYDEVGSWSGYSFDENGKLLDGYTDEFSTENLTILTYKKILDKLRNIDIKTDTTAVKKLYKDIKRLLPSSFSLPVAYLNNLITVAKHTDNKNIAEVIANFNNNVNTYNNLLSQEDINTIKNYINKLYKLFEVYGTDTNVFVEKAKKLLIDNFSNIDNRPDGSSEFDLLASVIFDLPNMKISKAIPELYTALAEITSYYPAYNYLASFIKDFESKVDIKVQEIRKEYAEKLKKEIADRHVADTSLTPEEQKTMRGNATNSIIDVLHQFKLGLKTTEETAKVINDNRTYLTDKDIKTVIRDILKDKYSAANKLITVLKRLEVVQSRIDKKWTKSGKDYTPYGISAKKGEYTDRTIKPNEGKGTKLDNWRKAGKTQINPAIKRFVIGTTADFKKLPDFLRKKIDNASLTLRDINYFIKTSANMNEYTFKAIAELVYQNTDLAQLSLKQYNKLRNELSAKYAILGTLVHELEKKDKLNLLDDYIDDPHRKMTIEEMDELWNKLRGVEDDDLKAAMEVASTLSARLRVQTKNSKFIDEAVVDPTVLHLPFFMHYDGTLDSLAHINNLGKQIDVNNKPITVKKAEAFSSDIDTSAVSGEGEGHHGEGRKAKGNTPWNWRWFAENDAGKIDYKYDEEALNKDLIQSSKENLQDTLDSIDRDDKVEAIMNYLTDEIVTRVEQMSPADKIKNAPRLLQELDDKRAELYDAPIDKIDKLYLKTLSTESKLETESQATQNIDSNTELLAEGNLKRSKKRLQTSVNTFEQRIIRPSRFEKLPNEIKQYFDPVYTKGGRIKGYKNNIFVAEMSKNGKHVLKWNLNEKYANMTPEQLDKIAATIQEGSRILGKVANQANIEKMAKQKAKEMLKEREGILTKQTTDKKPNPKAPMKEKVAVTYKTQIVDQKFYVTSDRKPTDLTNSLLDTNWSEKNRMSTVQGVTGNVEKDVANGATFFSQNSDALLRATAIDGEIENTCRWFLDTRLNNATDADFQKFQAIKLYFLGWVLENAQKNSDFANLPNSLIQEIEHALKSKATENATGLAIWNNIRKRLNPAEAMSKAAMIIDGVEIPDDLKGDLFQTVETGSVADMAAIQDKIIQYVEEHRTGKKSIFRKLVSVRSASMLSSPLTWLRNKVSNIALKRLNMLSDKIGAKIMPKRTVEGQLKMDDKLKVTFGKDGKVIIGSKTVRPEVTKAIQDFVNDNFIDNGMFDTFCKNLSRYNPSEISDAARAYAVDKITGEPRKEYIMSQLVLKAMYNEYYNKNMFKSKGMQKVYSFLMQAMSDDSYVRETSIRYFGQILAEKGTDLSQGMTDGIMNDFAKAMGLALRDYMHSDNLFNKFEKMLLDKNEAYWLTYKLLLPYAGSAWNWFKGMMNYTPIGLIDGIRKFWKLENTVMKNEAKWMKGQTDIPGELTEFFVRRQIGSGVLGTIGTIIGALLASLGLVRLDDDDYGTPKIKIGNISVDVSSIFGSSSILTGAAFVNGIMKKDMWTALGQAFDYTLDSFPLMDIIHSDMYSESIIDTIANRGESIALSFIPNFLSYVAGATYTGNIKKTTFWDKLGAKLPFVGNFLPKKVNPYTGDKGGVIDLINRIVPYFSYDAASVNESKSEELGLTKKQLRGDYDINGKSFKVTGKDLENINVKYGQLNAKDLGQFYTNSLKVRVKTSTGYQELTYNQMTDAQRKTAVNSIMSENAKVVKIMAWTSAGHKYYASLDLYNKLRANGITKNIYRGTKGYSD